jgi:hypothetical protein
MTTVDRQARAWVARAWIATTLVAVGFVAGLIAAYVIEGFVAGATVGDQRSLASDLLGWVAILVLVGVPGVAAWRAGRRAERAGDSRGKIPRLVGSGLAVIAILVFAVQILVNASRGLY